jgi:hypothetical protein
VTREVLVTSAFDVMLMIDLSPSVVPAAGLHSRSRWTRRVSGLGKGRPQASCSVEPAVGLRPCRGRGENDHSRSRPSDSFPSTISAPSRSSGPNPPRLFWPNSTAALYRPSDSVHYAELPAGATLRSLDCPDARVTLLGVRDALRRASTAMIPPLTSPIVRSAGLV